MTNSRPRYTDQAFPAYSYVPGHAPHPVSDPAGHMFGVEHRTPQPLVPETWRESAEYLYGIDLFNHGFYWEAHETWESLWLAAGRTGKNADFLKGLIKLAAAGVKAREGNARGVVRHANRAAELLSLHKAAGQFCGIAIACLLNDCQTTMRSAEKYSRPQPTLQLPVVIQV